MRTKLNEVIRDRRSIRVLERSETITKKKIEDMLRLALYSPNAFKMQSSRMIVLLDREHEKFWDMTVSYTHLFSALLPASTSFVSSWPLPS